MLAKKSRIFVVRPPAPPCYPAPMKLGLLSDTHGHTTRTAHACRLLLDAGAEHLIHCGDIGGEGVLAEIAAAVAPRKLRASVVLGNVDQWNDDYRFFPTSAGIDLLGRVGEITLDGVPIAIVHGDDAAALGRAIHSGKFRYVFTGHTHAFSDERTGPTRVVNPGAVFRSPHPSVALLDTGTDTLTQLLL